MFKTLLTTILTMLAVAIAAAFPANANVWSWIKNTNLEPKDPVAAYQVETEGFNVRVYEFTLASSPGTVCVMAFGTDVAVGLQCVNTTEDK